MCTSEQYMVRIKTSGKFEWRKDLYDSTGEVLDENTRSGAIDGACEFSRKMVGQNLPRAMDHPDMTEELAKILSTSKVRLDYRVKTDIHINETRARQRLQR